jgi:hypothetical protein
MFLVDQRAEVEFAQVPMQVRFGDVVEHAVDAALQDAAVAFHGVGVDRRVLLADVLATAVGGAPVVGVVPAEVR